MTGMEVSCPQCQGLLTVEMRQMEIPPAVNAVKRMFQKEFKDYGFGGSLDCPHCRKKVFVTLTVTA